MRYLGNKSRLSKELAPILMKNLNGKNSYCEPFVGACGMMQAIDYKSRFGTDINPYIIALLEFISQGGKIQDLGFDLNEDLYNKVKQNPEKYSKALVGFLGFGCSFGGKFFGGFARTAGRDLVQESLRNLEKLAPKLHDVTFYCESYDTFYQNVTDAVIYCDIPYANTTKYKHQFDHDAFWDWARKISKDNYVYVSEYNAPDDFECIWSKEYKVGIDHNFKQHNKAVERLFVYKG